jgi:hypothetical protein
LVWLAAAVATLASTATSAGASPTRSPVYLDLGATVGAHPSLGDHWPSVSVSADIKIGLGLWLGQRIGFAVQTGVFPRLSNEGPSAARAAGAVTETLRFLPLRAGVKLNIWPRVDWIQLNLVAMGSLAIGYRELSFDGAVQARERFDSAGGFAGVELNAIKFKQAGVGLSLGYVVQPLELPGDCGFATSGSIDIGGLEMSLGLVGFFGGPR